MHDNTIDFEKIFLKMLDDFQNFQKLLIQKFPLYGIIVPTIKCNIESKQNILKEIEFKKGVGIDHYNKK